MCPFVIEQLRHNIRMAAQDGIKQDVEALRICGHDIARLGEETLDLVLVTVKRTLHQICDAVDRLHCANYKREARPIHLKISDLNFN